MKKITWIEFSFFCGTTDWNIVFNKIYGFSKIINSGICLKIWHLEFNRFSEENILFSIPSMISDHNILIKQIYDLFIETPNITISHVTDISRLRDISTYNLPNSISHSIIGAFQYDKVDQESVITFAYQLYIGFLKVLSETKEFGLRIFVEFLKNRNAESDIAIHNEILQQQFQENEIWLTETAKKIFMDNFAPEWLIIWIDTCRNAANDTYVYGDFLHKRVVYLVFKHLAMSSSDEIVLSYFVFNVVNNLPVI